MITSHPYWWDVGGKPTSPQQTALPESVDVLVIGAGLTGLSAARTLARRGRSVLVVDAEAPGYGASSRNGGQIGSGHRFSFERLKTDYGEAAATEIMRESYIDVLDFAHQLIADEDLDCDFVKCGRFRGYWTHKEYDDNARSLEKLTKIVPIEAEMIASSDQHEEVGTSLYRGGTVFHAHGSLNPAKYVAELLRVVRAAGAQVEGATPVTAVEKNGKTWTVTTPRGNVKAGAVLAATNGYTPWVLAETKRRIISVPSFIIATEPLGENRIRSLFPKGRVMVETRLRHCYYRASPDGTRVLFGGRAAMWDVPEAYATRELKRLMTEVFPDLRDVALTHSWRGKLGFNFAMMPFVGQIDGIWHAMGYSGSGNAFAPYAGHKAALQILGDPEGATAFSKTSFTPRWWHPGVGWFLPIADMKLRAQDMMGNWQRSREG